MTDLSILTLTRNQPHYVGRLDEALTAALARLPSGVTYEKILVNNGAKRKRKTWDPVTKFAVQSGWKVIEPGYNTSFSEGNNLGATAARGEYLLLLNDDALPEPDALVELWNVRKRAEVIGCLIVQDDGRVNHAGTEVLDWPDHIGRGDSLEQWHSRGFHWRESVTFACALVRADWYEERGGLDEAYVYSFEDTDFCLRTLEAGGRVAVQLDAVVRHNECGTRPSGGTNDQANGARYRMLWSERVRPLVAAYRNEVRKDA